VIDGTKTMNQVVKEMLDLNAGFVRTVGETVEGEPRFALILAVGPENTRDVLALFDAYGAEENGDVNPTPAMLAGPALLTAGRDAAAVLDAALGGGQIRADSDDGREATRVLRALEEAIAKASGEVASDG